MTDRPSRREFLLRSALLAAGVSTLPLVCPVSSLAQRGVVAEDLIMPGRRYSMGLPWG